MLINVSFQPVKEFIPRVPEYRGPKENGRIKRIYLTNSVENAVNAMPDGVKALKGMMKISKAYKNLITVLYVYELKENKMPFIWYPKDIEKYVFDAKATKEHWITEKADFKEHILKIEEVEYGKCEFYDCGAADIVTGDIVIKVKYKELKNNYENRIIDVTRESGYRGDIRRFFKSVLNKDL